MPDSLLNVLVGSNNTNAAAVLILSAGDTALIANPSSTNVVYYGNNPALTPTYQNAIPLEPNSYVTLKAQQDVYACTEPGVATNIYVLPGGQNFFQPTIINGSELFNVNLLIYEGTPAIGNLISSIAGINGTDPFGNGFTSGITAYELGDAGIAVSLSDGSVDYGQVNNAGTMSVVYSNSFIPVGSNGGYYLSENGSGAGEATVIVSGDNSGSTDWSAINNALNLPSQPKVKLVPGIYYVNQDITVPALGILQGAKGNTYVDAALSGSTIYPVSGFSGAQVITLSGDECEVSDLNIVNLGGALPTGIHGISCVAGFVNYPLIKNVSVSNVTGHGIVSPGGVGWRIRHCYIGAAEQSGYALSSTDSTYEDLASISAGQQGFIINNPANCKFTDCRAEWGSNHGFNITGDDTCTGGVQFDNCSTDRNAHNGFEISATGNWPIIISGYNCRRDGSAGSSAGINYNNAINPVIVNGMTVFPGFNDDGSGTQSPEYGIYYTPYGGGGSFLQVSNAMLHVPPGGTPLGGIAPNVNRAISTRTGNWYTIPLATTLVPDNA